jgi:hypothetical protein
MSLRRLFQEQRAFQTGIQRGDMPLQLGHSDQSLEDSNQVPVSRLSGSFLSCLHVKQHTICGIPRCAPPPTLCQASEQVEAFSSKLLRWLQISQCLLYLVRGKLGGRLLPRRERKNGTGLFKHGMDLFHDAPLGLL